MRSKGEVAEDCLRLKMLKIAAQITATISKIIPKLWFLLPSFEIMLITEMPIIEIMVKNHWRKVGFSFKISADISITATGTNAIITPERAEDTSDKP